MLKKHNFETNLKVNGTGHPTLQDFIAAGTKIKMKEQRCREIIDELAELQYLYSSSSSSSSLKPLLLQSEGSWRFMRNQRLQPTALSKAVVP